MHKETTNTNFIAFYIDDLFSGHSGFEFQFAFL